MAATSPASAAAAARLRRSAPRVVHSRPAATGTRINANPGFCAVRTPSNKRAVRGALRQSTSAVPSRAKLKTSTCALSIHQMIGLHARRTVALVPSFETAHHANTASKRDIDNGERVVPMQSDRADDRQYGGDGKRYSQK